MRMDVVRIAAWLIVISFALGVVGMLVKRKA